MNASQSGSSEVIVTVASDVDVIEALKLARPRVLRTLYPLVAIAGLLLHCAMVGSDCGRAEISIEHDAGCNL